MEQASSPGDKDMPQSSSSESDSDDSDAEKGSNTKISKLARKKPEPKALRYRQNTIHPEMIEQEPVEVALLPGQAWPLVEDEFEQEEPPYQVSHQEPDDQMGSNWPPAKFCQDDRKRQRCPQKRFYDQPNLMESSVIPDTLVTELAEIVLSPPIPPDRPSVKRVLSQPPASQERLPGSAREAEIGDVFDFADPVRLTRHYELVLPSTDDALLQWDKVTIDRHCDARSCKMCQGFAMMDITVHHDMPDTSECSLIDPVLSLFSGNSEVHLPANPSKADSEMLELLNDTSLTNPLTIVWKLKSGRGVFSSPNHVFKAILKKHNLLQLGKPGLFVPHVIFIHRQGRLLSFRFGHTDLEQFVSTKPPTFSLVVPYQDMIEMKDNIYDLASSNTAPVPEVQATNAGILSASTRSSIMSYANIALASINTYFMTKAAD